VLSPDGGGFRLRFANGGHPDPLLIRADGTVSYYPPATPRGLLIGVLTDAVYNATTLHLRPGDTLLLYTDGLPEARTGPPGHRYGDDALRAFASNLTGASAVRAVTAIAGLLESFGDGLDDDAAILALSVPPASP
jgi:sigma-B regulation protein RsbU (phosphoserine phosphatase)